MLVVTVKSVHVVDAAGKVTGSVDVDLAKAVESGEVLLGLIRW
ncbi:hypothetical protein [Rhizohabitans arisaemae]|nr:hypothetical protein [Rhizohabitans arisaemae]